jgi:hypothetical protein
VKKPVSIEPGGTGQAAVGYALARDGRRSACQTPFLAQQNQLCSLTENYVRAFVSQAE